MAREMTTVDLGIIRVRTSGMRDEIILAHNGLLAVTVLCHKSKPSTLRIADRFYTYSNAQWTEVMQAYLTWKRKVAPQFKLPEHSGRTRDGHVHPWRRTTKTTPDERTGA